MQQEVVEIASSVTGIFAPSIQGQNTINALPGRQECSNDEIWQDADAYDPAAREAQQKELQRLFQKININALISRASKLRAGISCSAPNFKCKPERWSSVMGGMNYHIELVFEDGVSWLARIRRFNATSPPPKLRDHIIRSEAATLKYLETINVPTPEIFGYALEGDDNPVGVGYMLIEKLPGTSLRWPTTTAQQKTRIMEGLADAFIELQKTPFNNMGCLKDASLLQVGPLARESLTDFDGSRMISLGPCSSVREYHERSLQLILSQIIRRQVYADRPVDAYLIHRFLLDLVPKVVQESAQETQNFYLKHADDKGDQILVDNEYNITGIIDWEWAYTAPAELAFNSPVVLLPVAEFYDGVNTLGSEEKEFIHIFEKKGRVDLADIVRHGRLQHRFAFCCGYDLADWDGFLGLFKGLRDAVSIDNLSDWTEWKQIALKRYQEDRGLQLLLYQSERP